MRLTALVEAIDHVCSRYRLAAFRRPLAAAGVQLDLQVLPQHPLARLRIGSGLEASDAVIVQRKLLPCWAVALLRRRARRLIFDFDDAVWLRDSYARQGFDDPRRLRRFRAIVAASDLIIAGNDYLAEAAMRYSTRQKVVVIPTCVDLAVYPLANHSRTDGVQLVWVGSGSTLRGLDRFRETLATLGRSIPRLRLKLICDQFLQIPDLPVDECPWRAETESAEIASADIGISWIPDDPWSRGKCGLKILQYQAAGLPVVTNPVGVHPRLVRASLTGFTAVTTGEWQNAISRLAADSVLRNKLGHNGRLQVEKEFSLEAGARGWLRALEQVAAIAPLRKSG